MKVSHEVITPELAKAMLAASTINRKVRRHTVEQYALDMRQGHWRENGETIQIAADGGLLNGQHRLRAVMLSGLPQKFVVVRGLPRDAQDTIDTGIKRVYSDVLAMRGEKYATNLAALTRRVWNHLCGRTPRMAGQATSASNAALDAVLESHPDLRELCVMAAGPYLSLPISQSMTAYCLWLFRARDKDDAKDFFDKLTRREGLFEGDPIWLLAATLDRVYSGNRLRMYSQEYVIAVIIKAWNAYREGRKVYQLRYGPGGRNPEAFPNPL